MLELVSSSRLHAHMPNHCTQGGAVNHDSLRTAPELVSPRRRSFLLNKRGRVKVAPRPESGELVASKKPGDLTARRTAVHVLFCFHAGSLLLNYHGQTKQFRADERKLLKQNRGPDRAQFWRAGQRRSNANGTLIESNVLCCQLSSGFGKTPAN